MNTKQNLPESELRGKTAEVSGADYVQDSAGQTGAAQEDFAEKQIKLKFHGRPAFRRRARISGTNGSGAILFLRMSDALRVLSKLLYFGRKL